MRVGRPNLPPGLHGRSANNWRHLIAIADIDPEINFSRRIRKAATSLDRPADPGTDYLGSCFCKTSVGLFSERQSRSPCLQPNSQPRWARWRIVPGRSGRFQEHPSRCGRSPALAGAIRCGSETKFRVHRLHEQEFEATKLPAFYELLRSLPFRSPPGSKRHNAPSEPGEEVLPDFASLSSATSHHILSGAIRNGQKFSEPAGLWRCGRSVRLSWASGRTARHIRRARRVSGIRLRPNTEGS